MHGMERWPKARSCNQVFTRRPSKSQLGSISETGFSHCCVLGPDGKILTEGRLRSTPETNGSPFSRSSACAQSPSKWGLTRGG